MGRQTSDPRALAPRMGPHPVRLLHLGWPPGPCTRLWREMTPDKTVVSDGTAL